jgi:hypothetical protein
MHESVSRFKDLSGLRRVVCCVIKTIPTNHSSAMAPAHPLPDEQAVLEA